MCNEGLLFLYADLQVIKDVIFFQNGKSRRRRFYFQKKVFTLYSYLLHFPCDYTYLNFTSFGKTVSKAHP